MSYLDGPRINFWGGASTNVDTANNEGTPLIDLVTTEVIEGDDRIIAALRRPATMNAQPYYTVAGWNYYGDHQVAFLDAKVSSSGAPGSVSTEGDLAGQPVYLLGSIDPESGEGPYAGPVMVDLDPTSSQTTQIYVGGFQIGGGSEPALLVRADTRCHAHFLGLRYDSKTTAPPYLTPGSVYANGTFQVAFPKDAVVRADRNVGILQAILDAPGAVGIVVRFSFFEFMPGLDTDAIQKGYAGNRNPDNPSLGRVIGTVGPWFAGEPATSPPGRLLQNTKLGGAQGLAWLDGANRRLTLDLVSALQGKAIRQHSQGNTAPIGPNVDYGELKVSTAGQPPVASFPSLPDTYYLFGGIYDVALPGEAAVEQLANHQILIGGTKSELAIQESRFRIYGDPRNLYLDELGGKAELELTVRELGGPVQSDITVKLATGISGTLPDPGFLDYPGEVTVTAGSDRASIPVSAKPGAGPGFLALNVKIGTQSTVSYFVNFRRYPDDDFSAVIAAGSIPWETVYEHCLRYYYLLFPAMSRRIPLNDEQTIQATAGEILKRISDRYRPTSLYMPLTRSLSPGKVALLKAYLEQGQGAG